MNKENVEDRKAMIESINALIDALGILNNGLTTYRRCDTIIVKDQK